MCLFKREQVRFYSQTEHGSRADSTYLGLNGLGQVTNPPWIYGVILRTDNLKVGNTIDW